MLIGSKFSFFLNYYCWPLDMIGGVCPAQPQGRHLHCRFHQFVNSLWPLSGWWQSRCSLIHTKVPHGLEVPQFGPEEGNTSLGGHPGPFVVLIFNVATDDLLATYGFKLHLYGSFVIFSTAQIFLLRSRLIAKWVLHSCIQRSSWHHKHNILKEWIDPQRWWTPRPTWQLKRGRENRFHLAQSPHEIDGCILETLPQPPSSMCVPGTCSGPLSAPGSLPSSLSTWSTLPPLGLHWDLSKIHILSRHPPAEAPSNLILVSVI